MQDVDLVRLLRGNLARLDHVVAENQDRLVHAESGPSQLTDDDLRRINMIAYNTAAVVLRSIVRDIETAIGLVAPPEPPPARKKPGLHLWLVK